MSQPNAVFEFVQRYGPPAGEEGPVLFVREVFGVTPDHWQERALRAFGRGERRISIRSAHGVGKTALAAWLIILMILTRFPQKTVATAPSSSQLKGVLLPEVKMWIRALPARLQELLEVKAEGVYLREAPESSYFEARTARADSPEALQGVHSDHVLLIADEASGVPEPIFEGAMGSMSAPNATTLLLGNPVRTSGLFFKSHNQLKSDWFTIHVTAVPGTAGELSSRIDADFIDQVAKTYGHESNAFRVRALGEFPRGDDDTVIPYEFIEMARTRDIVVRPNLREVWGVDIARGGGDLSALVRRNSMEVLPDILVWNSNDLMVSTGKIKLLWDNTPPHARPQSILVDVIGMGGGVVDRLRELALPVRGINVAETSGMSDRYRSLRDELWFRGREWFTSRDHKLPRCDVVGGCARECPHEGLASELSWPTWKPTSSGKNKVESKDELKSRGFRSPNIADAFLLTLAEDVAGTIHGTGSMAGHNYRWHEPIRRGRSMV